MAQHIIQCRICRQKFDTEKEDFVLVGQRSYYHKSCYEEWVASRNSAKANGDEDFWKESVIDYLYRDIKMEVDFAKLTSQWENFTKPEKKMTPKGIYFALKYFYEVQHGEVVKAQGGIGIVPSIYRESAQYWTERETRKEGTIEAIVQQIKERRARPVVKIEHKKEEKNKSKFNLDNI